VSDSILWYATRGAGIVSLLMLTGVVGLGVLTSLRLQSPSWPRFLTAGLHRNLALLAVAFLVIHIVTAVIDPFTALGPLAALVPFASSYRPLWLGLGVVALDLLLALVVTSLLRVRIGHRAWRAVHWLAYAAWPVALLHGVGTGSDSAAMWMRLIDVLCIAIVAGATAWRASTSRPALRRPPAAPAWLGSAPSTHEHGRDH
jgi:sulfoxide reductase heme-binding subunit YedZ